MIIFNDDIDWEVEFPFSSLAIRLGPKELSVEQHRNLLNGIHRRIIEKEELCVKEAISIYLRRKPLAHEMENISRAFCIKNDPFSYMLLLGRSIVCKIKRFLSDSVSDIESEEEFLLRISIEFQEIKNYYA